MISLMSTIRQRIAETVYPEAIEERRSLERRLEMDYMTGVGNKLAFDKAIRRAERDPKTAVIVFDMNNLGIANKVGGHSCGDELILEMVDNLKKVLVAWELPIRVFRIGGDEFVVLCDRTSARKVIDDTRQSFGVHRLKNGVLVSVSGSSGDTFEEADDQLQVIKTRNKTQEASALLYGR
jgi:diguanylate cyclase (GGDEF)-like protein